MKYSSFLLKSIFITLIASKSYALRVGIFTGTFDPPHNGHKNSVHRAINFGDLDIVYVETGVPDHKPNALPYEERIEMLGYVFKDTPQFKRVPSYVKEMFKSKKYTDAIRALLEIHKNDTVFRIIGSDKFSSKTVISLLDTKLQYIINPRDPEDLKLPFAPKVLNRPQTVLMPPAEFSVSSTEVRRDVKNGIKNPHLDPHIYKKILDLGAYKAPSCASLL